MLYEVITSYAVSGLAVLPSWLDYRMLRGAGRRSSLNPKDISAASREWADGIWFSGPVSADRFRTAHPDMKNPGGPVFHSMLVFYTRNNFV